MKQTVEELHQALWSLFETLRSKLATSDYRDALLPALALKAASDRQHYRAVVAERDNDPMRTRFRAVGEELVLADVEKDRSKPAKSGLRRRRKPPPVPRELSPALLVPGSPERLAHIGPPVSRPSWSRLTNRPDLLLKELGRLRRSTEKQEPSLRGALDGLDALFAHEQTLPPVIQALARFHLDPASFEVPWAFGELVDRLILDFAHRDRARGEFCTSPGVARLMTALLGIEPGLSIHDPAAGTCRLLVECAKQAVQVGQDPGGLLLSGTELDRSGWAAGRINLWSCGLDATAFQHGAAVVGRERDGFDRVVCDPPFGSRVPISDDEGRWLGLENDRAHVENVFVARALGLLKSGGRAVVLVPQGFLFRSDKISTALRRRLVDEQLIKAVVQLPPGLLFGTSITTSILVLERVSRSADRNVVRFIDASSAAWDSESKDLSQAAAELIRASLVGNYTNVPTSGARAQEIVDADYNLAPNRFLPHRSLPDVLGAAERGAAGWRSHPEDLVLTDEQSRVIEELSIALADGGVVNLIGPPRVGKTTALRQLRRRLGDETLVQVDCSRLARGAFATAIHDKLRPEEPRRGNVVLVLDDWDMAGELLGDDEIADVQRLLVAVLERGSGSGVVFASTQPVGVLQASWGREVLPRAILGQTQVVTFGERAEIAQQWKSLTRRLRKHLVRCFEREGIDERLLSEAFERSRNVPISGSEIARVLEEFGEAFQWERFLHELAERHPWLAEESRTQGFDLERGHGELPGFLLRLNLSAAQFIGELMRPTDIGRLFPEATQHDKASALREAFEAWRASQARGSKYRTDDAAEAEQPVARRRT